MQVILHLPQKRMNSNKENTQVINRRKQIIIFQRREEEEQKKNNIPFQIFFIRFVQLADSSLLFYFQTLHKKKYNHYHHDP